VEDLHWCDPSSLELLGRLMEQSPVAPLMVVGTARPEFHPAWPARSHVTPLTLGRLTRRQARDMVGKLCGGRTLPETVCEAIVARADGVPLYVEELTRMVLESGLLVERDGRWELTAPLAALAIPATLQDSLTARLDRLSAAKEVAQRAAVLGREFSYALLAATAGLDEPALRQGLARLVGAELLFARGEPPEATYVFKHALIQEAAYQSLLRKTRHELHARVAGVLEERFPARAEAAPEVVARHWEAAGAMERAFAHYQRAGEQAARRVAHAEAIAHLRKAIALLSTLPAGRERSLREIDLHLALGASTVAVRGYAHPDTEAIFEHARELAEASGDASRLAFALEGVSNVCFGRCEWERTLALAERVLDIGRRTGADVHVLFAHTTIGQIRCYQGRPAETVTALDQAVALYDPERHHAGVFVWGEDLGVTSHIYLALAHWMLGRADRALAEARASVALARRLAHPFSLGFALTSEAWVHWLRGDRAAQRAAAEAAIALSETHGFPLWLGLGRAYRAAALEGAEALSEASEGLTLVATTGNRASTPFFTALLAEIERAAGRHAEALAAVEEEHVVAAATDQGFWDAELTRLKGELLLESGRGSAADAERLFGRAIEIARGQKALALELRAATSLARTLRARGRRDEARGVLEPVYAAFTEGFDTHDLVAAKALLQEIASR
jgi:predicted ATPase